MVIDVADATFEAEVLKHAGVCVVDFWAPWCGPCKMVAPVFKALAEELSSIKFTKVNVDENQVFPSKFGIQSIPTFIVCKNGKEVARKMGAMNKDTLSAWVKSF